ncbi:RAI1-domain-containing protein [Sistotremastrum suecicum HHB10207 ss-3]|uniref:Decapping nuclease n=1 Tax=Sistotremastrum suecicum HHB10207 ss-3 TaxID=1314776 RepID=A0A166GM95_9AGAM|nr:RAI1-domain-containing protein [Sistotremastrum suecicum HHB10207 ss-3]
MDKSSKRTITQLLNESAEESSASNGEGEAGVGSDGPTAPTAPTSADKEGDPWQEGSSSSANSRPRAKVARTRQNSPTAFRTASRSPVLMTVNAPSGSTPNAITIQTLPLSIIHIPRSSRPSSPVQMRTPIPAPAPAAPPLVQGPPPPFQKPHQLVAFSYTPAREQVFDNSSLRYFIEPPRNADLGYGIQRWIRKPEERARLDGLLVACLRKEVKAERKRADFITWRGIMTKIFTAPYEQREGWDLNVMCVNGTIYLEEHVSDRQLDLKQDLAPDHLRMTYYGYAFESYCTRSEPPLKQNGDGNTPAPSKPGWGGDVDTNVQWCSVVKTKLGDLRLILGGEVDCVRDTYVGQPDTFVELKTSAEIRSTYKGDKRKFELKLLKFYTQSFLLGVPEIVVGFRSPEGRLTQYLPFQTSRLPKLVRESTKQWEPGTCVQWAHETLQFLKRTVGTATGTVTRAGSPGDYESRARNVWRLRFEPGFGLKLWLLHESEVKSQVEVGEQERVGFLPKSYFEEMLASMAKKEVV